ncbi:hypothetical protein BO82DRAFT_119551 [Aspergillus uvarum CBS 121591]|uniref:Uncharacterized protein n=1 Tax=Aspergillus uvarum CBS 121591 TaxID=1448315 RepID=A0A319C497_9EURO|nr:hypothetical protein BO82DRAFT_119551 [Aspergillus uvarum CBS 121591]PYH80015.1 hypothetical protein BO82DRAFT_119551 [Aspergillus uvarum CBS 121591]
MLLSTSKKKISGGLEQRRPPTQTVPCRDLQNKVMTTRYFLHSPQCYLPMCTPQISNPPSNNTAAAAAAAATTTASSMSSSLSSSSYPQFKIHDRSGRRKSLFLATSDRSCQAPPFHQ